MPQFRLLRRSACPVPRTGFPATCPGWPLKLRICPRGVPWLRSQSRHLQEVVWLAMWGEENRRLLWIQAHCQSLTILHTKNYFIKKIVCLFFEFFFGSEYNLLQKVINGVFPVLIRNNAHTICLFEQLFYVLLISFFFSLERFTLASPKLVTSCLVIYCNLAHRKYCI